VTVRLLADGSCDFAVVRALRAAGDDVAAVAELAGAAPDDEVIELARAQRRVLLTEDKDFGQLFFAGAREAGVVLGRCPANSRSALGQVVVELVARHALGGRFVVVEPGRFRFSSSR
jgi:predicted nuclease of predicted toxin-antitoxin system